MPPPARSVCDVDDLGVGRARRDELVVRAAADDRAAVEHDDLIGVADARDALRDDDHRRRSRCAARAQRAGAPRSRGRAPRTSRRTGTPPGSRSSARAIDEPLALAARDVRAALRDRRVELLRHRRDEVPAPARPRARPTARRRSRRGCRSAGSSRRCPMNRYGALRHHADRAPTAPRARGRGRRRRRRARCPPVGSTSRGISSSSVVLPAPVEPMIAVTSPGLRDERDVARAPARSAPG